MIKETITPMSLKSTANNGSATSAAANLAGADADKGLFARIMALMEESPTQKLAMSAGGGSGESEEASFGGLNMVRISAAEMNSEEEGAETAGLTISTEDAGEESAIASAELIENGGVAVISDQTAQSEQQKERDVKEGTKKESDPVGAESEALPLTGMVTAETPAEETMVKSRSGQPTEGEDTVAGSKTVIQTEAATQKAELSTENMNTGTAAEEITEVPKGLIENDSAIPLGQSGTETAENLSEELSAPGDSTEGSFIRDIRSSQGGEASAGVASEKGKDHEDVNPRSPNRVTESNAEAVNSKDHQKTASHATQEPAMELSATADAAPVEESVSKDAAKEQERGRGTEGERKESFAALMDSRPGAQTGRQGSFSGGQGDKQAFTVPANGEAEPKEEVSFKEHFKEVSDTDPNRAEESLSGLMKLGELNISNVMLRDRVVPGLSRAVQQTASAPKAEQAEWQQHVFEMEDGQKVEMSTRNVDGVIQVKIASGNSELGRLIQMYSEEIREYLEQECEVSVDLQFEDQTGSAGSSEDGSAGNNGSNEQGFRGRGVRDTEGLSRQQEQKIQNSIRRFGYNRMEWTV